MFFIQIQFTQPKVHPKFTIKGFLVQSQSCATTKLSQEQFITQKGAPHPSAVPPPPRQAATNLLPVSMHLPRWTFPVHGIIQYGVLCDQLRPLTFLPGGGVIGASFLCVPEGSSLVHRDHLLSIHLWVEPWYSRFSGSAGDGFQDQICGCSCPLQRGPS